MNEMYEWQTFWPWLKKKKNRNLSLFSHRVPTLAVWGTVGGVALVHFTDWRLVLDYVPYISGKFKRDE